MKLKFCRPEWDGNVHVKDCVWAYDLDGNSYSLELDEELYAVDSGAEDRSGMAWQAKYCLKMVKLTCNWTKDK